MRRLVAQGAAATNVDIPVEVSARERVRGRRQARKRRKSLRVAVAVVLLVGTVVGSYTTGFSYYSSHYFPGTTVAGINASGMTEDELARTFGEAVATYESHVTRDALDVSFAAADIDLTADAQTTAHQLMARQDASNWPTVLLGAQATHDRGITFNTQKLSALVQDAVEKHNKSAKEPTSAALKYDAQAKSFSLTPEKVGTMLNARATYKAVRDAVAELQTSITLADDVLVQPEVVVSSDEAQTALDRANAVFDLQIPLVRNAEVLATIDKTTFGSWVSCKGLSVTFKQDAATAWADDLGASLDYADDNNVYVMDSAALVSAMTDYANSDGSAPVEVPYVTTPRYLPGGGTLNPTAWDANYGRYIDINKTSQVACLYDATGRVLWETIVTTGTENEKTHNGTPEGEFSIYDKQADFVLLGEDLNKDGQPDYERPVDYWMPFNGNIGLHDAPWRKVYGGEEYKKSGSSGCVNLPKEAATALFAIARVGDVVVVHY